MTVRIRPIHLVQSGTAPDMSFEKSLPMVLYGWDHNGEHFAGAYELIEQYWGIPAAVTRVAPRLIPLPDALNVSTVTDVWRLLVDNTPAIEDVLEAQPGDFCYIGMAHGLYDVDLPTRWRTDRAFTWYPLSVPWGTSPFRPSNGGFCLMHMHPGAGGILAELPSWIDWREGRASLWTAKTPAQRQLFWRDQPGRIVHETTHMLGLTDANHAVSPSGPPVVSTHWTSATAAEAYASGNLAPPPALSPLELAMARASVLYEGAPSPTPLPTPSPGPAPSPAPTPTPGPAPPTLPSGAVRFTGTFDGTIERA